MSSQALMITKKQYTDLKEYWDFQRVQEYNKERIKHTLDNVEGKVFNQFGDTISTEIMFEEIWNRMESEDLKPPHKGWIPQDKKLRFEWEPDPNAPKRLPNIPKGRPVVLRARNYNDDNII